MRSLVPLVLAAALLPACGDKDDEGQTDGTDGATDAADADDGTDGNDGDDGDDSTDGDDGTDGTEDTVSIAYAGNRWGECLGTCNLRLSIDGATVTLDAGDYLMTHVYTTNTGTLTASGVTDLDAALTDLAGRALLETYGCPDCADGGASYLRLDRPEGSQTDHSWEYSNPPPDLAATDPLLQDLIGALTACTSSGRVTVSEGCTPAW